MLYQNFLYAFHFHFSSRKENIFLYFFLHSQIHIFLFTLSSSASYSRCSPYTNIFKMPFKCEGEKKFQWKRNICILIINKIQIVHHYMNNCGIFSRELFFYDTTMILLSAKKKVIDTLKYIKLKLLKIATHDFARRFKFKSLNKHAINVTWDNKTVCVSECCKNIL